MNLRQLAIRVLESGGLVRQVHLRTLRSYLKKEPEDELIKGVSNCETTAQLRVLWEAGLSDRMQQAVTERLQIIKE